MDNRQGGKQFVHCREVVHSSECPLSEVPLYLLIFVIKLSLRASKTDFKFQDSYSPIRDIQ